MGLFDFLKKYKKSVPLAENVKEEKKEETKTETKTETKKELPLHTQEYLNALQRYDKAQSDKEYQRKSKQFYELLMQIQEAYSVINNVGSFNDGAGDSLIEKCINALAIEADIKEKRERYENCVFDMSTPCKTLAMVYEKRCEYQRAATICVYAIENGYTNDGTKGGMRGRLARMMKKGNLPMTDNIKNILNL